MTNEISQTKYNFIHGFFLVMNFIGLVWYGKQCRDIHYFVKYFSIQGFMLAVLYSVTSMFKSTKQSKINQVLHELSLTSNVIVCLGYWVVVRFSISNFISHSFLLCNDFIHTMPILMIFSINYIENLDYFQVKNIRYQIYFMVIAITINVFYTIWHGPVYSFMTYKDSQTAILLVGGFVLLLLIFLGMGKVTKIRIQHNQNLKKQ